MGNEYYKNHSKEYIDRTFPIDMSFLYDEFLKRIPKGGTILDAGFGSGRDILYFQKEGYRVFGIDAEAAFVEHARSLGLEVALGDILSYDDGRRFDGIWACASLVHMNRAKMKEAVAHLSTLLNENGILMVSLKYGNHEYEDEQGRHFTEADEAFLEELGFAGIAISSDTLGRSVPWINGFLKKR